MSVQGIHGTNPHVIVTNTAGDTTAAAASRSRAQGPTAEPTATDSTDGTQDKPAPVRFPWLSRLSTQLAAASKTPTTFSAPVLGDNLDKQA